MQNKPVTYVGTTLVFVTKKLIDQIHVWVLEEKLHTIQTYYFVRKVVSMPYAMKHLLT